MALDHESFRETGQVAAPIFRDDDEILYADAADFRVVDAGLDGDDVAGDEPVLGEGDARGLVDLQPDPVPRAVEEALRKRLAFFLVVHVGLVARRVQHLGDPVVNVLAAYAGLYHGEGRFLALQYGVVHLLQTIVRFALDERAGHVRVVAGREVDGENVHDDRLSRLQGAVAALVRVSALRAAGDDGAVGGAPAPEQLHVYPPAQPLARQRLALPL